MHAQEMTQRRGGPIDHEPIDAAEAERQFALEAPVRDASPEAVFERQWAIATTERAMVRLAHEYDRRQQSDVFSRLRPLLTSNSVGAQLGAPITTSDRADRMALSRLRRRFADALRAEIADTVTSPAEVDDELRYLLRTLVTNQSPSC
jgi:RNA polymerase sigma-70 factor (ECF subfamily)